jgi:hypothetical protein
MPAEQDRMAIAARGRCFVSRAGSGSPATNRRGSRAGCAWRAGRERPEILPPPE